MTSTGFESTILPPKYFKYNFNGITLNLKGFIVSPTSVSSQIRQDWKAFTKEFCQDRSNYYI